MSDTGRTQVASIPDVASANAASDGACAAGTFPTRLANRPNRKPLDLQQRLALGALIASGRMIRRSDGFGTDEATLIPAAVAAFLKGRRYAYSSFDGHTIYPSEKAKTLIAEERNAP